VKVLSERGTIDAPHLAKKVILTIHPSYLLRGVDGEKRSQEMKSFVEDLRSALDA
jgi:uracil-DNA glycosylase